VSTKRISDQDLAAMTPHEAASYWFVRQDAGHMTDDDRQALETWLAASAMNHRAYEQTHSMWVNFEEPGDEGELRALRVAALAVGRAPKVWPKALAIATGIVAAVGLGTGAWHYSTQYRSHTATAAGGNTTQYVTGHNQRSTVTLPDGTRVYMNLDTGLDVDFSTAERLIHLTRGQAFFEVAKDRHRPFIVAASDREIQALGTKFDVRLDPDRVEVVLLEGRVSVDRSRPSWLDKVFDGPMHVELQPDQRLVAAVGKPPEIMATNAAQAISWREGWIVFEDETIEQAIREFNRYSAQSIVVADEAVKRLRFSGVFRIGEPERFATTIQELMPVAVERGVHGETVLVPRPEAGVPQH
jgi:transmembrane sensor